MWAQMEGRWRVKGWRDGEWRDGEVGVEEMERWGVEERMDLYHLSPVTL